MDADKNTFMSDAQWAANFPGTQAVIMEEWRSRPRAASVLDKCSSTDWKGRFLHVGTTIERPVLPIIKVNDRKPGDLVKYQKLVGKSETFRINRELGVTVVVAEHDTSRLLAVSDAVIFMENGVVTAQGAPKDVLRTRPSERILSDMPAPVRLYHETGAPGECPLDVKEGRAAFYGYKSGKPGRKPAYGGVALSVKDLYFRYGRDGKDVLRGTGLEVREG